MNDAPDKTILDQIEHKSDGEWAELAAQLRQLAHEPRQQFAAHLDEQVAHGFPRSRGFMGRAFQPRTRQGTLLAGLGAACSLLAAIVITVNVGQTGTEGQSSDPLSGQAPVSGAPTADQALPEMAPQSENFNMPQVQKQSADAQVQSGGSAMSTGTTPGGQRKTEQRTHLVVATEPDRVDDLVTRASEIAEDAGGHVFSSNLTQSADGGRAVLDLRIPAKQLQDTVRRLSRLGEVTLLEQGEQDITGQFDSAENSLRSLRSERADLVAELKTTTNVSRRRQIAQRLTTIRDLERAYLQQIERLNRRADISRIQLEVLGQKGVEKRDDSWGFDDAAPAALRALTVMGSVALVAAAIFAPLLVIGLVAAWIVRVIRRRARERTLGE